jgi:hypothetical protein
LLKTLYLRAHIEHQAGTCDSIAIRTSPGLKGLNEILVLYTLMTNYAGLLTTLFQVGYQRISQPAVRPGEYFQSIYGVVMKGDSLGDYLLTVRWLRDFV